MNVNVSIPFVCYVNVKVEASSKDEAIEKAMEEAYISSYCGNGGSDKLIGVSASNLSIHADEDPLGHKDFEIMVYDEYYDEIDWDNE